MFQLTDEESLVMVSQNAIPSKQHMGGTLPFVFTEQGIAAISTVLTSDIAIEVNIQIMLSFVVMRRFIKCKYFSTSECCRNSASRSRI